MTRVCFSLGMPGPCMCACVYVYVGRLGGVRNPTESFNGTKMALFRLSCVENVMGGQSDGGSGVCLRRPARSPVRAD